MNNLTDPVQVVQTHQALLGHNSHKRKGHTLVVVALDHLKQVHSKDLKHHHEMFSMRTVMEETVEQLHTVTVFPCDVLELFRLVFVIFLELF
jgi:hypothetical protein